MNFRKNARLTPKGRAHLEQQIKAIGLTPAATAAGVSACTARKWLRRYTDEGVAGLLDRSSKPRHSPKRSSTDKRQRVVALRRLRLTYAVIAERVGLSTSTVARICAATGVARLPPLQQGPAVRRYERKTAGELLHLDTKKLARFARPGHRVTGDRTRHTLRAGYHALHVAINDHSRVGFSQVLPDETTKSACTHLLAALRYYKQLGVIVLAVMTENEVSAQLQRLGLYLQALCQVAAALEDQARPYTPRTNGKAERFIQTLLREWAYKYRYPSSDHRTAELPSWMHHYNFCRPHTATSNKPPATRLGFEGNNVSRTYI